MPQVFEIRIAQKLGLKELTLLSWRSQRGIAIFWIIAIIVAFASLGSAIVATYNVSLFGQIDTGLSLRAESMAKSGYRFLFSEYQDKTTDVLKNELLDELHGKTFNIAPDGKGGQFELNMTSYFYRIETVTNDSQLKVKFLGAPGIETVLSTGYLRNIEDDTLYGYGSWSSVDDVYTFNLTGGQTVPSTDLYTTVLPAADITTIVDNGDGTLTLTLGSGQGALFPPEKGMFLITREQIKANLPVMQVIPYYYEYRNGDQLFKVAKGPGLRDLINPTTSDKAEVAKFVSLESIGYAPNKANYTAREINKVQVSLDISASSSWHSSAGLKSYWSFDSTVAGEEGKDDYGDSGGTLAGDTTQTSEAEGKVGRALEFGGAGYVSTEFKPGKKIDRDFTVVFWAKPTDLSVEQGVIGVSAAGQSFFIGIKNEYWEWGLGDQSEYDPGTGSTGLPKAIVNQWQHVAFVYYYNEVDSKYYVKFYINGLDTEYIFDYGLTAAVLPNYNIYLGALYDPDVGNILGFTGSLDEIAIFSTALEICKIREIYDVPCNVGCDAIAYYPFNGNADDESGTDKDGDYDGIVNSATLTTDRFGCNDRAYNFDGTDDYIDIQGLVRPTAAFTYALWFRPDVALGSGSGRQDLLYGLTSDDARPHLTFNKPTPTADGKIGLYVQIDGTQRDDVKTTISSWSADWHLVVFTWDVSGNFKVYVDDDYQEPSSRHYAGTHEASTGMYISGTSSQNTLFKGKIDDVVVYDRALSADEAVALYDQ